MNADKLALLLAETGVVDPKAVEDPEGYDGGATMTRITAAANRLALVVVDPNVAVVTLSKVELLELKLLRDCLDIDREYELVAKLVGRASS